MNYKEGDLVWTKLRGHPWWPSIIEKINFKLKVPKYTVRFIGDNTISIVTKEKIIDFKAGIIYNYNNIKKKSLISAYEEAKSIYENKYGKLNLSNIEPFNVQSLNIKTKSVSFDVSKENSSHNQSSKKYIELSKNNVLSLNNYCKNKSNSIENCIKNGIYNKKYNLLNSKRRKSYNLNFNENTVTYKISLYLEYIYYNFSNINEEEEKYTILKITDYLNKISIIDPIMFLKSSLIGKYLKFLSFNLKTDTLLKEVNFSINRLEQCVLEYMFNQR